jgi:RNA polymerase sigma-70 factor (ECF subfamily)
VRVISNDDQRLTTTPQFDAVFLAHWQKVYRIALRLVGDDAEAQDLALETFWRLYQKPSSVRNENLLGWLYRVVTNLGLNALRARKRRATHEWSAGRRCLEQNVDDPQQAAEANEERERVRAILAEMDERQAQLLWLRHSGMKYAELADALGVSINSLGTLIARAEREFEKRYRQKGV